MEEPAARLLLTLLDGTRDRAEILAEFRERTGVPLSAEDLETNLDALGRSSSWVGVRGLTPN